MASITGVATTFIDFTRASNATVTDSDGVIKWAPHNLLLASEQFDAAAWVKYLATVSANTQSAPNGTTTADTVTASAGNDVHRLQRSVDVTIGASANASLSIFVKAGTHNFVTIGFYSATEVFVSATFNLASGSAATETDVGTTSGTVVSTEKVDVGTGWYRLTITGNYSGSSALSFVNFAQAATGNSYTNFGQPVANLVGTETLHLWGASLYRSDLGGMQPNTSAYPLYNPTTPKNLLGYTESLTTGWTNSNTTDAIVSEVNPVGLTGAVDVAATAGNGTLLSSLSLLASPYTFSVWLKRKTGSGTVEITVDGTTYVAAAVTGTWTRFSTTLTPTAGTKTPGIRLVTSGDAVYAWGAQLSDSASLDSYVPVYGAAVTSAAYYGPRRDFDGSTLACKGLLVEEQRANLLTYSDNFGSTGFPTATNIVVAENDTATTSPDGTTNADKLTDNATNDQHRLFDNYTFTAANAHTLSVYVKRDTHRWFRMLMSDGTTLFHANFDLLSGVVGQKAASVTSSNIIPLSNGWFRVSMTFTVVAAIGNIQMVMLNSDSTSSAVSYVGTGTSLWLYGLQIEANASFATSYIPTGVATSTRNADVASVSTQAFPYSATEGTIVVNATSALLPSAYTNGRAAALNDGTANNVIELYISQNAAVAVNAVGRVMLSGVQQTNPSKTITNSANPHKVAFAYKASDFAVTGDGLAPTTETSGSVPTGMTQMQLGALTTSNYLNGHIRQITYIPRRLSNAELQSRST